MNHLLWNILTLLIWAFPPVTARILLQWGMDKDTRLQWRQGLFLFIGSLALGASAGMLCGLSARYAPMKEAVSAAVGFLAQDLFIAMMTTTGYYRKRPRALLRGLLAAIAAALESKKKSKKDP